MLRASAKSAVARLVQGPKKRGQRRRTGTACSRLAMNYAVSHWVRAGPYTTAITSKLKLRWSKLAVPEGLSDRATAHSA